MLTSPEQLARHDVTVDELTAAVEKSNIVTGGGFLLSKTHESLIRIIGRAETSDEVADTVVRAGDQIVTAVLFFKFGRKVYEQIDDEEDAEISGPSAPLHLAKQFK